MTTNASSSGSTGSVDRPATVARPRLAERMKEGVQGPLTVLVAPAGYGKTAVVDQWAAQHRGAPVARVTFRADDDRVRAAARLTEAFVSLGADPSVPASAAQSGTTDASLGEQFLAGELAWTEDGILVLDAVDASPDA